MCTYKLTEFATPTPLLPPSSLTPQDGRNFLQYSFLLALPWQHSLFSVSDWTHTLKTSGRSVHSLLGPGRQSGAKCKSRSNFLTTSLVGSSFSDPEGVSTQQQNAYRFQLSVTNKGDILLQDCSEVWSQTGRRSIPLHMLCVQCVALHEAEWSQPLVI